MMIANLIDFYTREVLDWPTASAISIILLCLSGLLITALLRAKRGESSLRGIQWSLIWLRPFGAELALAWRGRSTCSCCYLL